jgi:ATP-binding protein involved in chromosome partitioning
MPPTEAEVLDALRRVRYPGFTRDIVAFGVVSDVAVEDGRVRLRLQPGPGAASVGDTIERDVRAALAAVPGVTDVTVLRPSGAPAGLPPVLGQRPSLAAAGGLDDELLPEVRHVVAVASGKGGVGKSTVAVNLAVALARSGARTGLLDADVYGPSIPLMMGTDEPPRVEPGRRRLVPFERFGVRFMSLGFLVEKDSAVIWRGPMVMKALTQLLGDVNWGALDVLVVDMPPGTGDAQLTLSQKVRLAGAVIVTTPQDVALADAVKGVAMFRKVDVPVLGIVENMSYFPCPHCGTRSEPFGHGGGRTAAERLGVPFLGEIPLDPAIREGGDAGTPVACEASGPRAEAFASLARSVLEALPAAAPEPPAPRGWLPRFGAR